MSVDQHSSVDANRLLLSRALDCVTANVMVADADYNIVFMNKTIRETMKNAESDIREVLSTFAVDQIEGANMDDFHRNPAHQRRMLSTLSDTFETRLVLGHRTFRLIANPVTCSAGTRLGTVIEWMDLTEELAYKAEKRAQAEAEQIRERELMQTLVREIHHRIKNHLQGVMGLLRQSFGGAPECAEIANDAINQIAAVATVHGLQSQTANCSLMDMVRTIAVAAIGGRGERPQFETSGDRIEGLHVREQEAVQVALVINELLTNAVKHSPRSDEAGAFSVHIDRLPDGVRLQVRNRVESLPPGFDFERGIGIGTGLKLARSLLSDSSSELSLNAENGEMSATLTLRHPVICTQD